MKYLAKIYLVAVLPVLLVNCTSQMADPSVYGRQWMMVGFKQYDKNFLIDKNAQLDMSPTKNAPNNFRAYMGCNTLFVEIQFFTNGKMNVGSIRNTKMNCEENGGLEQSFITELAKGTKYQIDGHYLTISTSSGTEIKFVAADWD